MKSNYSKVIVMFVCLVLLTGSLLIACGPEPAGPAQPTEQEAKAEYEWAMGSIQQDPAIVYNYNYSGKCQQVFIDLVNVRSDGRIKITPHYSSTIGGQRELFQAVSKGELPIWLGNPQGSSDQRFDSFKIPFILRGAYEDVTRRTTYGSPVFKLIDSWLGDHNMKLLSLFDCGFRSIYSTKPIHTMADLKGLKIRLPESPAGVRFWSEFALPCPMPWGEVYTALNLGTIDAAEGPSFAMMTVKLHEVCDYFIDIRWQAGFHEIMISTEVWDSLPPDLQGIVQKAAIEAGQYQVAAAYIDSENAVEAMKGKGVEVITFSPEEMEKLVVLAEKLIPDFIPLVGEAAYYDLIAALEASEA